jgi:hypothetical protein
VKKPVFQSDAIKAGLVALVLSLVDPALAAKAETQATRTTEPATLHAGRLAPVDEDAALRKTVKGLTSVPGTDVSLGYFLEPAAGLYSFRSGTLSWRAPQEGETHYLGITVTGSSDRRVLPECKVRASFATPDGRQCGSTVTLGFVWDPAFNHYGTNVSLGETTGPLTLYVTVEPPAFARRDKVLGAFFVKPVSFMWPTVSVPPAASKSEKTADERDQGRFGPGRYAPLEPTPYPGADKVGVREK